jgi:hypothetical protein
MALAVWGMGYGLYYAVFVEHQTLDRIGSSLATSFAGAAEGKAQAAWASLDAYSAASFVYVRQVDVHSHWIGLAMLLILLGVVFDRVSFSESTRFVLAVFLLIGSAAFPLGVALQTFDRGTAPLVVAAAASTLVIASLIGVALGLMRNAGDRDDG